MAIEKYQRRTQVDRERLISPILKSQQHAFLNIVSELYFADKATDSLTMQRALFTANEFMDITASANERSQEVQMEEVTDAAKIANGLYKNPIFQTLCIDGRILPVFVGGFSAGIGGSLRTPAGDLKEVVKDKDGGMKILPGSNIDILLDEAFQKNDEINELLDSHIECAAKKKGEGERGRKPTDGGLYEDVMRKSAIADAMIKHVDGKYQGHKKVNPIQFSFDPENGYAYMGLETTPAMKEGEKKKRFDHQVLETLIHEGKIISTFALSYESKIKDAFDRHLFFPDWTHEYPETAYQMWANISEMADELIPVIEERVRGVYGKSISDNEIHDRSLLLLTNAYSGYLHNYNQEYPYQSHIETGVGVTVGLHEPHQTALFAVNDHDVDNLPGNTSFAATIVRANREAGRVVSGILQGQEYIEAPVPVLVAETVKNPDAALESIGNMDFRDLPDSGWFYMTSSKFYAYLAEKNPNIALADARALNELRLKMVRLYTPRVSTAEQFMRGDLIPMPVITNKNREIVAIVPFLLKGY